MDLKPEVYYLTVESAKKQTLVIDSVHFFIPLFIVIFSRLGLLGAFGGIGSFMRAPQGPIKSFTSIVTLNPSQVQPPVQSVKFTDFWGMLNC